MATLSCAMVGPMDGIYLLNKSRVMTTCMADGTVLKPDIPVHTSDDCFMDPKNKTDPGQCWKYHTWSDIDGLGRIHYHFNNAAGEPLTPAMVHLDESDVGKYAVRNWYTGDVTLLGASNSLTAGYEGHVYATVTPIYSGWIFLGEVDKYTVASSKRFSGIEIDHDQAAASPTMRVFVNGVKDEVVKVCAVRKSELEKTVCNTVEFSKAGAVATEFK